MKKCVASAYGNLMNGYQKGDWKVTTDVYGPNVTILAPGKPTVKGKDSSHPSLFPPAFVGGEGGRFRCGEVLA